MSFKSMTITFDPRVMLPLVAVTALVGCNLFEPSVEETKPEDAQRRLQQPPGAGGLRDRQAVKRALCAVALCCVAPNVFLRA